MEYIVKNGTAREVIARFKATIDSLTNIVKATPLKAIYRVINGTAVLVWELVHSCFGSGYWRNDMPWSNTDGWNNGN